MADGSSLSIAVGVGLTVASTGATLVASLLEECLKSYHRSELFDHLDNSKHERFETYLKRDDEYFFVARLSRSFSYLGCCVGLLVAFAGGVTNFSQTVVLEALAGTVIVAILFAGVIPAVWARHGTEQLLTRLLPSFNTMTWFFKPFFHLSQALHAGVTKVRGDSAENETPEHEFEEDIADSLDEATRDGVISEDERKMISSALDFGDEVVEGTMTPRTEVIGIDINQSVDNAIELANTKGHSRLPVFESSNPDQIVGILYVRDALRHWQARNGSVPSIKEMMRSPIYVPESKKLIELLAEFRARRTQIAVVLDEFGGTAGIVTLEDLLEEIVGDLQDEFDMDEVIDSPMQFRRISDDVVEVDARIKVDDLNAEFKCSLPESDEYTSLGGLITAHLGRIPREGEKIPFEGVMLKVISAGERRVKKIRITRATSTSGSARVPAAQ